MYYDGNGNQVDIGYPNKTITTTVLGYDLQDDAGTAYGVSSEYVQEMKNAITLWSASFAGDDRQIPFIVHTDQHGRLNLNNKGLFDLLSYIVNWDNVSAIFNLGDTVVDHWEDDNTNTNPLLRNDMLEKAMICIKNVPKEKQINVYGNHDTWYNGVVSTPIAGTLPSMQYNNPYFTSDGLRTEKCPDNSGNMIIYDDKIMVKYLVVAGWDYADKGAGNTGYQWYFINAEHVKWIISKMEENTGHDLVIVSHVPLEMGSTIAYDPITNESIAKTNPIYIVHYSSYLNTLWNARKDKSSGSITLSGETIQYDFAQCDKPLLCAISGHTHYDGIDRVGGISTGLLQIAFDWFADLTIHFGLIDRRNNKINVWKLHNENNTPSINVWEAPLQSQ